MKVSAEIRWFWPREPAALAAWFKDGPEHKFVAGGGAEPPRVDEYLADPVQRELGIKQRGLAATTQKQPSGPEVKGLVDPHFADCVASPFAGPIELWAKWESSALALPKENRIITYKTRWLRKFDTARTPCVEIALNEKEDPKNEPLPDTGCNVEFTRVVVGGEAWWTFGFESFGKIGTVTDSLIAVASELAARRPPRFDSGTVQSYPQWMASLAPSKAKINA